VESFLLSRKRQTVPVDALNRSFRFEAWEPLQTESSHKFLESEIEALAWETGFVPVEHALDSRGWFMDSLWQVRG
jgi:L-histidine Nalpha-methyltransferase